MRASDGAHAKSASQATEEKPMKSNPTLKLWKTILAPAIAATALSSAATAALIGDWRHDEASGPLIDATGGHVPGDPTGFPTYGQAGVPNGAYGAITVSNALGTSIEYGPSTVDEFFTSGTDNINPVLNLDATGAFTVMGWVNPFALADATTRTYRFMSTGSFAGADRGWGIGLRMNNIVGTGSAIRFTTYGIADNDSGFFDLTFGNWIHLAATYDSGLITYFLNGNLIDTDVSSFGNEGAAGRLVIGGRVGANDADQMNGLIDGVRVYDSVLSETAIRQAAAESVSIPEPSVAIFGLVACGGLLARRRRG